MTDFWYRYLIILLIIFASSMAVVIVALPMLGLTWLITSAFGLGETGELVVRTVLTLVTMPLAVLLFAKFMERL